MQRRRSVTLSTFYRKNSKNWDTYNNYHNCPTIGTVGFYSAVLCSKDANRITNREDPDQTLIWVCTVCSDLFVPIFKIITVYGILHLCKISVWKSCLFQNLKSFEINYEIIKIASNLKQCKIFSQNVLQI